MARQNAAHLSFNRGEVARSALARVDLEKMRLSAEQQANWMPTVLGPMMLRPGTEMVGRTLNDAACRLLPFVFSNDDLALLELTNGKLRVWLVDEDDETLVTRVSTSTVVTNGDFSSSVGWTLTATGSGASATISGGKLNISSPAAGGLAQAKRTVSVIAGDQAKEHAFRIVIDRGPIRFRAGTTDGDDNVVNEMTLETGTHSIAFTPGAGTIHIQLETITAQLKIVDSITIEAAGTLELPTSWDADDLPYVRAAQSGDVVYVACRGQQQRRIERRSLTSWSVILYKTSDGPFGTGNASDISMTPSVLTGNGTLTASRKYFRSSHVGCLFRLFSSGQIVTAALAAENTFSSAIRITGVGNQRTFPYTVSGEWAGTLTLQRSLDGPTSGFVDVLNITSNGTNNRDDGLDNVVVWYRIGFKTGNYPNSNVTNGGFATDTDWTKGTGWTIAAGVASCDGSQAGNSDLEQTISGLTSGKTYSVTFTVSGYSAGTVRARLGGTNGTLRSANGTYTESITASSAGTIAIRGDADFVGNIDDVSIAPLTANVELSYTGGGSAGVARVTGYTSATVVDIEVLTAFSSLSATEDWNEGDWSDRLGWPSAVRFHDGRLWWAGRDRIWGSVSDAYDSFDIDFEGDAGPINRSVGFGPVDNILWLLDLSRLIVGREGAETSVRSGSLDEPLTPTNFTLKDCSTQGSANVPAVKIDTRGVFVQQSNRRIYELAFNVEIQDYKAHDLTRLNPDIGLEGFVDLDLQRQPDTQLHFVRGDGKVAALLHDTEDGVEAWWPYDSPACSGEIENVCILPGPLENRVYNVVSRNIGGTKRFIERHARRDQCSGRPEARLSDCHVIDDGGTTAVSAPHLAGQAVVLWAWNDDGTEGTDLGTGLNDAGVMQTVTLDGSGNTTIATAYDYVCVGLPYEARFKSARLAYAAQMGSALNQKKKINRLGLILLDTHYQGLRFGQNFTRMDNLPLSKGGQTIAAGTVHEDFDVPMFSNPGDWTTDARLCLLAASPRPATAMAAVIDITTNETP